MSITIYCPGGSDSQTGTAVKERYPNCSIIDSGKIPDIPPKLEAESGPYVIPIWNSHAGEVKAADYIWNHIQESKIKITDIWAKKIEFWFVRKIGDQVSSRKIGSVVVAKTQCSAFLAQQCSELIECQLTTIAFEEYKKGNDWDGVLVAPNQGENESSYEVISKQTANPNNFTSFVVFVSPKSFVPDAAIINSWLTGVKMPSLGDSLGEDVQEFFEQLLATVTDVNEVPKLIFVLKRTATAGLIFEGTRLHAGDLLSAEEQDTSDISIYEDAGATAELYSEELRVLFLTTFPSLQGEDFILHQGVNTCLFACPPLGLYTHGYEAKTVEAVVRFYVNKLFQCWDRGARCTRTQTEFFERHRDNWRKNRSKFMTFKVVAAV